MSAEKSINVIVQVQTQNALHLHKGCSAVCNQITLTGTVRCISIHEAGNDCSKRHVGEEIISLINKPQILSLSCKLKVTRKQLYFKICILKLFIAFKDK